MTAAGRVAAGDHLDAVAGWVQRLAVLLTAGLEPLAAVRAIEHPPPELAAAAACDSPYDVPRRMVEASVEGTPSTVPAWAVLAAAWTVALESGAPLAEALDRVADSLRALADADRQVDLAMAGPIATARIVAALPLLGLGMGLLIGADPLGVLFGTVPGAVGGAMGGALLTVGIRWNRRLVAAARRFDPLSGLGAELLALALAGGGTPENAASLVADALHRAGIAVELRDAEQTLAFARRAGVPVGVLLRADSSRQRRLASATALRQAALLGTRLLAPLGLCFLPSFVLLGVLPIVIGILRDAVGTFAG